MPQSSPRPGRVGRSSEAAADDRQRQEPPRRGRETTCPNRRGGEHERTRGACVHRRSRAGSWNGSTRGGRYAHASVLNHPLALPSGVRWPWNWLRFSCGIGPLPNPRSIDNGNHGCGHSVDDSLAGVSSIGNIPLAFGRGLRAVVASDPIRWASTLRRDFGQDLPNFLGRHASSRLQSQAFTSVLINVT